MSLKAVECGKPKCTTECEWCHKDYPCHGKGHDRMNCPRVEALEFLTQEEAYWNLSGTELLWDIKAVRFKQPLEFECEIPSSEDADED